MKDIAQRDCKTNLDAEGRKTLVCLLHSFHIVSEMQFTLS